MIKRVTLTVQGIVQGIGYRYASNAEAKRRGFTGYVRNTYNDTVILVAEGDAKT